MRLVIAAIFCCAGFASCITDRKLLNIYRKSDCYNGFNSKAVDGKYLNVIDTSHPWQTLTHDILACTSNKRKCRVKHDSVKAVALRYGGRHHAECNTQLLQWDYTPKVERVVTVRNKGTYLSLRRSFFLIPIPVLYYVQAEQKTLLLIDKDGRLVSVSHFKDFGWAFIVLGGFHDELHTATAQRL